ncbi:hypothetical protein [Salininema proteolyticum]|uniref:DUF5709 domain-containing protein n=1 Tax=Salininema proteolyticum TaxID=1607685 RepID=A0ABV8U5L3_9ACTN
MAEDFGQDDVPGADMGDDEQESEVELAERYLYDDPSKEREEYMFGEQLEGDGSISEYTRAEAGKSFRDEPLGIPPAAEEAGMHLDYTNSEGFDAPEPDEEESSD